MTPTLYERLAGDAWQEVPEAVRRAHAGEGPLQARGVFRIQHGRGYLARLLARLLRLPSPSAATRVQLHVTPSAHGERWERTFGSRRLVTLQHEAPGSLLGERFGPLELRFQLRPQAGVLSYLQEEAALCFGRSRLVLPPWLAPRVSATESTTEAARRSRTVVDVSLPLLGLLIRYEGELEVEEESA
ncbi:MAG TPA: DUF4166 domain-containing protein [Longimicrobiaceae bacterium]|nr:DUF4166 domain-containing protein [Longimicrobiaceae bacterium]